jgi:hypothetical protein
MTATIIDNTQPIVLTAKSTAFDDVSLDDSTATFILNSHDLTGQLLAVVVEYCRTLPSQ